jgi:hypothetical protein
VQNKAGQGASGTGQTLSVAFNSDVKAGSLLILVARNNFTGGSVSNPTITDSQGNSWNLVYYVTPALNNYFAMAFAFNAKAGPTTVNFKMGAAMATNGVVLSMGEYSGVDTVAPYDQHNQSGTAAFGTSVSAGSVTTTKNGELIIAVVGNASGATTYSAGSGFTIRSNGAESGNNGLIGFEDSVQAAAGAINPVINCSPTQNLWAAVMTFFAAGSPQRTLVGVGL